MKTILKLYSYIFHPLFVSVYTSLFYFGFHSKYYALSAIVILLAQIFLLTVLIPIAVFYLLRMLKLLRTDIMVNDVKQRKLPLAIQAMYFYFISFYTLKPIPDSDLKFFFIGALASTILALFAAILRQKISLHMIGVGGMASFIIGLSVKTSSPNLLLICALILLTGIVASSRLAMKAHTPSELFWGTVVGVYCQVQLFVYWL